MAITCSLALFANASAPAFCAEQPKSRLPAAAPAAKTSLTPKAIISDTEIQAQLKQGWSLLDQGKNEAALAKFNQIIRLAPDHYEAYYGAGTVLNELDKNEESVRMYKAALASPEMKRANARHIYVAQVYVNLGNALMQMGNLDEAIENYDKAIYIQPDEPRAHFNLARALLKKGGASENAMALSALAAAKELHFDTKQNIFAILALKNLLMYDEAIAQAESKLAATDAADNDDRALFTAARDDLKKEWLELPKPPVAVADRKYDLAMGKTYVFIPRQKSIIVIAPDNVDSDAGKQDGVNDGIMEMSTAEATRNEEKGVKCLSSKAVNRMLGNGSLNGSLLFTQFSACQKHDFVTFFGFKESKTDMEEDSGLEFHAFHSQSMGSLLGFGVDKEGRVRHTTLIVQRSLLDTPSEMLLGRDMVKSFVEGLNYDSPELKVLSREIYCRGLDLQPVDLSVAKLSSGKAIPAGTRAYKIGKQATQVDDKIIFIDKLPDFSGKASDSFQVVMGKLKQAVKLYGNCRLEFVNVESAAGRPAFVRCEAWDENYRQSHAEPAK